MTVLCADIASKSWARRGLADREVTVIPGVLRLALSSNTGGAFGFFRSGRFFFVAAGLVLLVCVVIFARRIHTRTGAVAGGLIVGGAVANLAERVFAPGGRVTDFIELKYWPTFNVADAAIVVGTLLAAVVIWRGGSPADPADSPEAFESGSGADPIADETRLTEGSSRGGSDR